MTEPRRRALGAYVFAGGFTVGMSRHFDVVAHLEGTPPYGVRTVRANWPELPVYPGPSAWPVGEWQRLIESGGMAPLDVIYANPPCAIFSSMGIATTRGKGAWRTDPRVQCWHDSFALLEQLRPRAWALESVTNAYTVGRELVDDLTRRALLLGYSVTHLLHDARWHGVPQERRRFFLVAHRPSKLVGYRPNWAPPPSVGEVLAGVPEPGTFSVRKRPDWAELIELTPPGQRLARTFERLHPGCHEVLNAHGKVAGRPSFTERRLGLDGPMGAWIGDKFYHPTEARMIGLEEGKALCGFPPEFVVAPEDLGGWGSLLARGVMPPVAEWLGRVLSQTLDQGDVATRADLTVTLVDVREPGRPDVDLTREYLTESGRVRFRVTAAQQSGAPSPAAEPATPPPAIAPISPRPVTAGAVAERSPARRPTAPPPPLSGPLSPDERPLPGEGSGRFVQRLWLTGSRSPSELLALVHAHYPGRTTRLSDVYYNYRKLVSAGTPCRAWPGAGRAPRAATASAGAGRAEPEPEPEPADAARRGEQDPTAPTIGRNAPAVAAAILASTRLPAPAVVTDPRPRPRAPVAIVDWYPRVCGATDFCGHLAAGAPAGADLVSFSSSGRVLGSWASPWPWRAFKRDEAADVLNDYDAVILGDLACFAPEVKFEPDDLGVPRPYYHTVMNRVRTPWSTFFHGGTYPARYDSVIDGVLSSPGFTGHLVTTRLAQARVRLEKWWNALTVHHHPYLPHWPGRVAPTQLPRRRAVMMTSRIAVNKGQNAAVVLADYLRGDVDVWGYSAYGLPSTAWQLFQLGRALGYREDAAPVVSEDRHSAHPDAPRFSTGPFALTASSGSRFRYRGAYGVDHPARTPDDVDWSPWLHLSLSAPEFGDTLEYVTLDAIRAGCVALVPDASVREARYESLVTMSYEGCWTWYDDRKDVLRVRDGFDRAALATQLNYYLQISEEALTALAARQRVEVERLHAPRRTFRIFERALRGDEPLDPSDLVMLNGVEQLEGAR